MKKNSVIYIAGHTGMVGSAMLRCLKEHGFNNLIVKTSKELNLQNQADTESFFKQEKPDHVFLAAARVGGIMANKTYRAEFIYNNIQIQSNVIHQAWKTKVKSLLFFASSCIYPKNSPQPMSEDFLWSGKLEPTNEPYAVAKLAGISMCRAYNEQYGTRFITAIPSNLYGENDNYDPVQSHLLAALIQKFHLAKINNDPEVILWGTGTPRRELTYVDDAADAALFLMEHESPEEIYNIGLGEDRTISEIAAIIQSIVGFKGKIRYDSSKPDGIQKKLLDVNKISQLGWRCSTALEDGISKTYKAYLKSRNT